LPLPVESVASRCTAYNMAAPLTIRYSKLSNLDIWNYSCITGLLTSPSTGVDKFSKNL